jgi:hypothetical protein
MNKFHSLHKFFKNKHKIKDRIELSIKGINSKKIDYENVGKRLKPYLGWKLNKNNNILPLRFEEMKDNQNESIKSLYVFLGKNNFFKNDISQLKFTDLVEASIDPNKSHTYRKGTTQNWKEKFDSELIYIFNENEGGILDLMDY